MEEVVLGMWGQGAARNNITEKKCVLPSERPDLKGTNKNHDNKVTNQITYHETDTFMEKYIYMCVCDIK